MIVDAILNTPPVTSIRLNPKKRAAPNVECVDNTAILQNNIIPWCSNGYYLHERPNFTHDPVLHAGGYYVQEPSSMIIEQLAPLLNNTTKPITNILDLCAAPGGKSTHLISIAPANSSITANEVIRSRVAPLKENILKWGNHSVNVTNKDPRQITDMMDRQGSLFDFILVDAPCSGEGMFRKDPTAIKEWSVENVAISAARQKRIVADIWPALSPGGYLAYSTCTFNIYENDLNIEWIKEQLGAVSIPLNLPDMEQWGVVKAPCGGYRFFPGLVKGEGLFFTLLQKNGTHSPTPKPQFNHSKSSHSNPNNPSFHSNSGKPHTTRPHSHTPAISNFIPEEPLSSNFLHNYPLIPLTHRQAIEYLANHSIKLPDETPLGLVVVTYGGLPLGYAKNIGTRANNLYPKNWRIRNL